MAEFRRRARDAAGAAPDLPGRGADRLLSSSTRADVWLFRDDSGGPDVAVKIYREVLDDAQREAFTTASGRLRAVSAHPAIATVHSGGFAGDGRAFLILEHCSGPALAQTIARHPASLADTLRLLVQLAGAVESAHRAGLAHGRVRVENVLTTGYGWPALVGFDSDALLRRNADTDAAPARATDVHGLAVAATELLSGRPIAESGAESGAADGADAVPAALERLVLDVLAASAGGGGPAAADFAEELQRIEVDLHLPLTHLDVREPGGGASDTGEQTVLSLRGVGPASPDTDDYTVLSTRHAPATPDTDDHTVLSTRHAPATPDTDDHTVLSTRGSGDGPRPSAGGAVPGPGGPDETVLVRRRDDGVVRGRRGTGRQAAVPEGGPERYRVRDARPMPEVVREPVAPPAARTDAPTRRRTPGRGAIVAVVGGGILVLGAALTAIVMLIGGGS
ncbi:protein kinase [Microbacterium oleivorans]|uniref:Protein kinase n=1 Tax=Microbacterium oleivorans TaxID=273677 RepID=A0A7D5IUX2_9MICO|nr:protein kinase [Microbacterium oleivorans]QLD10702.1 protein kinase [Microbacterium oleivorans]